MWEIYTHIALLLSFILLILFVFRDFPRRYSFFFIYFSAVFFGDIFFGYIGPQLGFTWEQAWYYNLFWIVEFSEHCLKILVVFSLYHLFLKEYPNLRVMLDFFFYGFIITLMILYLVGFNPQDSFFYNISIYMGKWVFLLMAVICTFILLIMRVCGISAAKSYLFILLGFLIYSLLQCLNFFLLSLYYDMLTGFWQRFYQVSYMIPTLLWFGAALCREAVEIKARTSVYASVQEALITRMESLEQLSNVVLKKMVPFLSKDKPE